MSNFKIINYLSLFFLGALFLVGCLNSSGIEISEQEKIENQIIAEIGNELKKEKQLILVGFGGSSLKGCEHLAISFDYDKHLNIKKARKLIVFTTNLFLHNLNTSEELKQYLKEPYSIKNIKIIIFTNLSDKTESIDKNVGIVDFIKGKITFYEKGDNLSTIHEETYEKALKIVESEKSNK